MDLKNENSFLTKGIQMFTLMCPQDHHARRQIWGNGVQSEKTRKVKHDVGPFIISLEEWDPDVVTKL